MTPVEAKTLLLFLERIQLHAREVDTYCAIRAKLRELAAPPPPTPDE